MTERRGLPPAVIFDWDNTLINTLPLISDAYNKVRAHFGLPAWSMAEVHENTQLSGREGLKKHYGDQSELAEKIFYDHIDANHLKAITVMDGAHELLLALQDMKIPMGIVSNKRGAILRKEIVHLGWNHFFRVVLGPDDVGNIGKPKPDGLFKAIEIMSIEPAQTPHVWYAGDTEGDLKTAKAAGVTPVFIENNTMSQPVAIEAIQPVFQFAACRECLDYLRGLDKVPQN
jgi:phosphoglycolate phosphatase